MEQTGGDNRAAKLKKLNALFIKANAFFTSNRDSIGEIAKRIRSLPLPGIKREADFLIDSYVPPAEEVLETFSKDLEEILIQANEVKRSFLKLKTPIDENKTKNVSDLIKYVTKIKDNGIQNVLLTLADIESALTEIGSSTSSSQEGKLKNTATQIITQVGELGQAMVNVGTSVNALISNTLIEINKFTELAVLEPTKLPSSRATAVDPSMPPTNDARGDAYDSFKENVATIVVTFDEIEDPIDTIFRSEERLTKPGLATDALAKVLEGINESLDDIIDNNTTIIDTIRNAIKNIRVLKDRTRTQNPESAEYITILNEGNEKMEIIKEDMAELFKKVEDFQTIVEDIDPTMTMNAASATKTKEAIAEMRSVKATAKKHIEELNTLRIYTRNPGAKALLSPSPSSSSAPSPSPSSSSTPSSSAAPIPTTPVPVSTPSSPDVNTHIKGMLTDIQTALKEVSSTVPQELKTQPWYKDIMDNLCCDVEEPSNSSNSSKGTSNTDTNPIELEDFEIPGVPDEDSTDVAILENLTTLLGRKPKKGNSDVEDVLVELIATIKANPPPFKRTKEKPSRVLFYYPIYTGIYHILYLLSRDRETHLANNNEDQVTKINKALDFINRLLEKLHINKLKTDGAKNLIGGDDKSKKGLRRSRRKSRS
jgi:hypothetical protein